jgi:hypothetical protein
MGFVLSALDLHIFVQWQATAHKCANCCQIQWEQQVPVAAHNLLGTPTGHITAQKNDNTYYQVTTMADAPQVKKWRKQEKQLLAELVKTVKVDLSCKNDVE